MICSFRSDPIRLQNMTLFNKITYAFNYFSSMFRDNVPLDVYMSEAFYLDGTFHSQLNSNLLMEDKGTENVIKNRKN